MFSADVLRLDTADPAILAEQQLARDGSRFVVFAGQVTTSPQIAPRPLRLTRLDPRARYEINLRNRACASQLSRGQHVLKDGPVALSGAALMQSGFTLPWRFPETMWVLEGTRL
jgi:alpha-galactosidase